MNQNQKEVLKFQKECFASYIDDIRKCIPAIPNPYIYPDGNPIRPVIPTKTVQNSIMIIGAFPSARFERRNKHLIPVGDNLSPFGQEEYFDGAQVRTQASRDSLNENYFTQLGVDPNQIWITDIVKIYLFPEKHIRNCKIINNQINYVDTHKMFSQIAVASMTWMKREIEVCNPKLIITLGAVAAQTISRDKKTPLKKLLNGEIRPLELEKTYNIAHLGHPEIRRIDEEWDILTARAIAKLANEIKRL